MPCPAAATAEVEAALDRIRDVGFATLNIDLIYGIDGQTPESWRYSLDAALAWEPEELYLYPLYVRPLTGLGRARTRLGRPAAGAVPDRPRPPARRGYEQVSMRMFRRPAAGGDGTDYCCQTDGMVGLGCGARSYTAGLHYSFEYAVGASLTRGIIDDYARTTDFAPRASASRWTTTSGAAATSSSRCSRRPACDGRTTGGGSAPTRPATSPPNWRASRTAAGWTTDQRPHPAHARRPGPLRRDRPGAVLAGVRTLMDAYEAR